MLLSDLKIQFLAQTNPYMLLMGPQLLVTVRLTLTQITLRLLQFLKDLQHLHSMGKMVVMVLLLLQQKLDP